MKNTNTLLVGGYIKTTLLDVDFIKALAIDSYTINSVNLTARNISTSASGKRVEITAAMNNFRIYDASENVLIELDDDSALEERYYHSGAVPPFYENIFGPGIRVGSAAAQSGSLSKRGLSTTTPAGEQQQLVGVDSSGYGKVQLDIQSGMILKNVSAAFDPGNPTYFKNVQVYYDTDVNGYNILSWNEI